MKAVCAALGVARSNVHLQAMRADDWIDGRTARVRDPVADLMLIGINRFRVRHPHRDCRDRLDQHRDSDHAASAYAVSLAGHRLSRSAGRVAHLMVSPVLAVVPVVSRPCLGYVKYLGHWADFHNKSAIGRRSTRLLAGVMVRTFLSRRMTSPTHSHPMSTGQKRMPIKLPKSALIARVKFHTTAPATSCKKKNFREILGFMLFLVEFG